jgi:hypothetical protein
MSTNAIIQAILVSALNIIVFPLVLIWGINTLLGMYIEFTGWNWLASWMIISSFRGAKLKVDK